MTQFVLRHVIYFENNNIEFVGWGFCHYYYYNTNIFKLFTDNKAANIRKCSI